LIFNHPTCLLGRRLFLARNDLARTLASARVGMGALTANRQALAMTEAAIASQIHQAFDALLYFAAQVAFDLVSAINHVTDADLLLGGEVAGLAVAVDLGLGENTAAAVLPMP